MSDKIFAGKQFVRVPGSTPIFGTRGPLFTYTVFVQRGLGLWPKANARRIDAILSDPRGWTRGNVRFRRVENGAGTSVLIADPNVTDAVCAPLKTEGQVSCCRDSFIVINVNRWKTGVPHWPNKDVYTYRQMLVNHEFGHRIGKGHQNCPSPGRKAPVMQQQTYGLQNCLANSWPLTSELL
jgi:Protein of unknown function (DUF3152)